MKKIKLLFVVLLAVLVLPFTVLADEATDGESKEVKEVNVYLFHGDGCPHCEDAQTWFKSIEKEYGDKFNFITYEVWHDQSNSELMEAVANVRGETADGVPYLVVGNQSWSGWDASYQSQVIDKIESEYALAEGERYDVMNYVELTGNPVESKTNNSSTGRDVLITILVMAFAGVFIAGVMYARATSDNN